jgi:hypothetical protein
MLICLSPGLNPEGSISSQHFLKEHEDNLLGLAVNPDGSANLAGDSSDRIPAHARRFDTSQRRHYGSIIARLNADGSELSTAPSWVGAV